MPSDAALFSDLNAEYLLRSYCVLSFASRMKSCGERRTPREILNDLAGYAFRLLHLAAS